MMNTKSCTSKNDVDWVKEKEVIKSSKPILLTIWCLKHFPIFLLRFIIFCNAIFYHLFNKRAGRETGRFINQLESFTNSKSQKNLSFRMVHSFAVTVTEKVECWVNPSFVPKVRFQNDDVYPLINQLNENKGAFIMCSHLGNTEALRYLSTINNIGLKKEVPIAVLMDLDTTSNFSNTIKSINPGFLDNIINVDNITPETIIRMQDIVDKGGMVVCAGDRISKNPNSKYFRIPFLGKDAPFSYGPSLIASLINAPVYFMFGLKEKDSVFNSEYTFYVQKSKTSFSGQRRNREMQMKSLTEEFATYLGNLCVKYPAQWYNFFDFWDFPETGIQVL